MMRILRQTAYRILLSAPLIRLYDRNSQQQTLGQRGELEAERFFLRQGWLIIERSFRHPLGEIDLIGVDGQTVVFVEVKTRTGDRYGDPTEAVDAQKRRRITQAAKAYLKANQLTETRVRFDVVSIIWPATDQPSTIAHYRDAFESEDLFQIF